MAGSLETCSPFHRGLGDIWLILWTVITWLGVVCQETFLLVLLLLHRNMHRLGLAVGHRRLPAIRRGVMKGLDGIANHKTIEYVLHTKC